MYCSTDTNTCQKSSATLRLGDYGLDELFYKYGVDFFFVGHVHNVCCLFFCQQLNDMVMIICSMRECMIFIMEQQQHQQVI